MTKDNISNSANNVLRKTGEGISTSGMGVLPTIATISTVDKLSTGKWNVVENTVSTLTGKVLDKGIDKVMKGSKIEDKNGFVREALLNSIDKHQEKGNE